MTCNPTQPEKALSTELRSSHTPGPWTIGDEQKREDPLMIYCDDSLGSRVADCSRSGHGITTYQDRANARLIAAAPDLLALAKQYASECSGCNGTSVVARQIGGDGFGGRSAALADVEASCPDCADIRAVIDLAEGREHV